MAILSDIALISTFSLFTDPFMSSAKINAYI
jgi:hypothetical protein